MNDFFKFDKMITTSIIKFVWGISSAAAIVIGLFIIIGNLGTYGSGAMVLFGLILMVGGPFLVRIYCELLIVLFKINENIQAIRNEAIKKSEM
ncbi:DUF4282 domain-containing protein [Bacillus sp. D386]|uniref:DUF4282 domain-containing protein n=1 Tax=Bacillus sp. D386 TaxID=2587155 RepID=UPI00111FB77C|nr:DUF4282 domain-containing protein [Bacillus sp. D386]